MDDFKITKEEQKIMDLAKSVVLSASEKQEIKDSIKLHIKSNPIEVGNKISIFELISNKSFYVLPALAVLVLVIGLNYRTGQNDQISYTEDIENSAPTVSFMAMSVQDDTNLNIEDSNTRMAKSNPDEVQLMMAAGFAEDVVVEEKGFIENIKEKIINFYQSIKNRF